MTTQPARIAVYDLDRTITRRPTYSLFLLRSAWRIDPARLVFAPLVPLLMLLYKLRLFGRARLKEAMWAVLLGRVDPARMEAAIADFTAWNLRANIRPGARRQLAGDRDSGALLVLATAAHELYALPIARALGFDMVVATRARLCGDGRHGASLSGANLYGKAKLTALRRALANLSIARTGYAATFYSDCASDTPLFAWCDTPVAVNPSKKLARLAAEQGWPIVNWNEDRRPPSWRTFRTAASGGMV